MVEVSFLDTALFTAEDYCGILALLPEERRGRAERCRVKSAAYLSAAAGYLLCRALKQAGLSERKVFYGEHGKPYIEGLHFNLSHSGTVAVMAIADGDVGVDIQKTDPVKEELLRRVCTEREYAYLNGFSGAERAREFFRLWTAKESAGKYLGTGLTNPREFETDLLRKTVVKSGTELRVSLREYPFAGYVLTVCAAEPFKEALTEVRFKE